MFQIPPSPPMMLTPQRHFDWYGVILFALGIIGGMVIYSFRRYIRKK